MLDQHYKAFSKAAGLPLQQERAWVTGFGPKQAKEALRTYETKVIRQAGGKYTVGDPEWALRREDETVEFYEYVRKQDTDIKRIANAAKMSVQDVTQIKNHIFFNKHIMWDGSYALFYPQYDMAVAWQRLSTGTPNETDLLLLKHELLESQYEKEYNLTADQAHRMATKTYDWDGMIFKLYGEAGEPDGVLQID